MVLFLLTMGVFLASFYLRKTEVQWLGMFISVCSIAMTLTDETLTSDEVTVLVILAFFIMILMGRNAFTNKKS